VFGDLPGFSRLPEKDLPIFWATVMQAIGDVVQAEGENVALKNTWGDAVHFVIPDVRKAAEVCLAVQRRLAQLDGKQLGRDEPPTMRIGAHYGPVFQGNDPIVGSPTFFGRSLSRAARIEPITPPGAVYVTEAFAAILLLESRGEFICTYVGQVPLAKGFGTFRMYDLSAKPTALGAS
jgi:class 3 adenylate cyclase